MRDLISRGMMGVVALATLGGANAAAEQITALDAALTLQGAISDGDFFLLTQFFGFQAGDTLHYRSITDANTSMWSATLSGTYSGMNLNVTYQGDFSAFPSGRITWTTDGSYGPNAWGGSGSALILDRSTTFQTDYRSSLTVGGNSGSFNERIEASKNPIEFLDDFGSVVINGTPFPLGSTGIFRRTQVDEIDRIVTDFEIIDGLEFLTDEYKKTTISTGVVMLDGPLSTAVPEPSARVPFGTGLLGLLGYAWLRRKRAAARADQSISSPAALTGPAGSGASSKTRRTRPGYPA